MSTKVLILAGGSGTRFWPKSTKEKPKQFLKIISDETMLQETFKRISKITPRENTYVVTNNGYFDHVRGQINIPQENILLEPIGKNTAAAIAFGISKMKDEDVAVVLPSDHYIKDVETYIEILKKSIDFAYKNEAIVTLGIKPTRAETGYGYIEVDKVAIANLIRNLDSSKKTAPLKVKRFHEKPNEETAYSYFESGNFFWNSGMFIFKVSTMKNAFKVYLPNMYEEFFESKEKKIEDIYDSIESISIDYAILEKANNVFVIPADFGWSDVGSWDALYELVGKDENGNYSSAKKTIFRNAHNCAVFAEGKRVVISHLDDIIIVVNGDDILVTKRGTTQDVKNVRME